MSNKHTIRNLKEAFDWEAYVEEHHAVKYANGRNGRELRVCCPHCQESSFKCYVNPDRKAFNCFKCDFKTGQEFDLFDFVALTEGITRGQALLRLLMEYRPTAPDDEIPYGGDSEQGEVSSDESSDGAPDCIQLPTGARPLSLSDSNQFSKYLQQRGFTERDFLATQVHYLPKRRVSLFDKNRKYKGNIGRRILFPVYYKGTLVSWQARVHPAFSKPGDSKYITAPDTTVTDYLWPGVPPKDLKRVVLVEGVIDALSVRRTGASAYATFTKHISISQIKILKEWGVTEVTLWWDTEDAFKEMVSTVDTLKTHFQEVYVLDLEDWPKEQDTGDLLSDTQGADIISEALKKRISTYSLEYERWKMTFEATSS